MPIVDITKGYSVIVIMVFIAIYWSIMPFKSDFRLSRLSFKGANHLLFQLKVDFIFLVQFVLLFK